MIFFKYLFLLIVFMGFSFRSISQNKPLNKKNKCTAFVYNLSRGNMNMKNLCFTIVNTDHINMNEFNPGRVADKTKDFWKFSISIIDHEKKSEFNFNASFYIYEENDEIKQYHCIIEDADIKAVIFDKIRNRWQILMLQNDDFKILSTYSGYHYTNAFGIKQKMKANDEGY